MSLIQGAPVVHPEHATLQAPEGKFFGMSPVTVWKALGKAIADLQQERGFHCHAGLLMSNHVHLLLTSPAGRMEQLLGELARRLVSGLGSDCGLSGSNSGLGTHRYEIRHPLYFSRAVKYIYRNPVRAGMCARVEEYPFSTLHAFLGAAELPFPLHETYFSHGLPRNTEEFLRWLNTPVVELQPATFFTAESTAP